MLKIFGGLMAAAVIPFFLLNMLGGLVSGIWLAIIGEWSVIFLGLAIAAFGAMAAAILLIPGIAVAGLGTVALGRGQNIIGWLLLLLGSPWTALVIIVWEASVFITFQQHVTSRNAIPIWLWTYGAATGVWTYLARKESQSGEGGASAMQAFAAQVAFFVLSICTIGLGWSVHDSLFSMAIPLLLPLIVGVLTIGLSLSWQRD